jgi:L-fuculose-phosphate aldolase
MGDATDGEVLLAARQRVAAAARRLAEQELVIGTAGNVSERAGGLVAITPTGAVLGDLSADQIAIVDLDGAQVGGELAATSELELHLGVYRRYDAGAVVHTHAPLATALSCVLDELPVVHYQLLLLGGPVRVAPYATFGSRELADGTLEALSDRSAALMANHGAIVHGPDLDAALERSQLLEWVCEVYWRAAAIGSPRALDSDERTAVLNAAVARSYGTTQRHDGGEA